MHKLRWRHTNNWPNIMWENSLLRKKFPNQIIVCYSGNLTPRVLLRVWSPTCNGPVSVCKRGPGKDFSPDSQLYCETITGWIAVRWLGCEAHYKYLIIRSVTNTIYVGDHAQHINLHMFCTGNCFTGINSAQSYK